MSRVTTAALVCALLAAAPAAALDVRVKDVKVGSTIVHASIELRDLVPDRFKRLLDENRTLHLRIQAELWESRPVWDRLVYPAIVRVIQITRDSLPASPMPIALDLGDVKRLVPAARYYVHVI